MNNFKFFLLLGSFTLVTSYKIETSPISDNNTRNYKIIGGTSASEGSFPYQILLQELGQFSCGGSFIIVNGTHFVLTAAHCVINVPTSILSVVAGEVDRYKVSGNEQTRRVTRIIMHPKFGKHDLVNDIALLVIDKPFTVNSYVSPIPLPKQGQTTTGEVIVTGWGLTSIFFRTRTRLLQKVRLTILDDNPCRLLYLVPFQWIHSSMLCAGKLVGGSDSCDGDSGGPMKAVNGGYLAGIVSWGTICAFPLQPGVNTEVSHYIDWIEQEARTV
ncbi:unnamed protein product [Orchesella dallaii]|uniref:Peptidase S1 domain-containing protein n=1 Tax=Orchesella dallaii TaxID=48710 RepID=A0ABP1RVU6_9HEXA